MWSPGPRPEIRMLPNGDPFLSFFSSNPKPLCGSPRKEQASAPHPTPTRVGEAYLRPAPPRDPSPVYCCLLEQFVLTLEEPADSLTPSQDGGIFSLTCGESKTQTQCLSIMP